MLQNWVKFKIRWFRSTVLNLPPCYKRHNTPTLLKTSSVLTLNESDQALPRTKYWFILFSMLFPLLKCVLCHLAKYLSSFKAWVTCLLLHSSSTPSADSTPELRFISIPILPSIEIQRWLSLNKYIFWKH